MSTHIPFDIQMQIIERFPVKSLIRFRSACKALKSFIDSAEFITGYRTQYQHLMISYEVGPMDEEDVKFVDFVDDDSFPQQKFAPTAPLPPPPFIRPTPILIDSSHGLLCLTNKYKGMAVLWNPAIRKSILVGMPNVVLSPLFWYVFGFGVCPVTKDPKLVHITYIYDTTRIESVSCIPSQVMVFTLSSGEWTTLPSSRNLLPRKSIRFRSSQTVIGQFIYLLAYERTNGFHYLIMSFDLSTYEFREIHLPDSLRLRGSHASISRLRESLVLLDYDIFFTTDKQVYDVWMMEHADSKVFTKLFTVNAPNASVWRTAGFRKSGKPIFEMDDDDNDMCTLVVYEPCLEQIKDLGIHGNCGSFIVSSYTESLLLLDHDDGVEL